MVGIPAVDDPGSWPDQPTLVEARTDWLLDLLDEFNTRSTCFVLGWVADRYPELVRRIAERGHEIASHGFWHQRVFTQSKSQFREDIERSLDAIQGACPDVVVRGYRAPSFSITPGAEWAFDILADLGFSYDSSLFPGSRENGGYPCSEDPHEVEGPDGGKLAELPMTLGVFGPFKLCFSGGGYMRLFPLSMIQRGFRQLNRRNRSVVVYLHPRDFATECPRVSMPPHRRFKCYVGLASTERKLRALLETHRFDTCATVLSERGLIAETHMTQDAVA